MHAPRSWKRSAGSSGGIAHDFNNILQGVLGNAELGLARLPADHPCHRNFDGSRYAASRAADLVRQIVTFSRPQETKLGTVATRPGTQRGTRAAACDHPIEHRVSGGYCRAHARYPGRPRAAAPDPGESRDERSPGHRSRGGPDRDQHAADAARPGDEAQRPWTRARLLRPGHRARQWTRHGQETLSARSTPSSPPRPPPEAEGSGFRWCTASCAHWAAP